MHAAEEAKATSAKAASAKAEKHLQRGKALLQKKLPLQYDKEVENTRKKEEKPYFKKK